MERLALRKSLTWVHGSAMAVGSVLGSGVLILPAITAEQSGPASILAWCCMSLLAFPLAGTIGRLGSLYPNAGGIVDYVRMAFGARAGYITAWLFIGTVPIGLPIIALVGADYAVGVLGLPTFLVPILAAFMLMVSIYLNHLGIDLASWAQLVLVAIIAILMVTAIISALPHMHRTSFTPFVPHGWWNVGASAVSIFWCFVGWEMVAHLAEEFRNPKKDLGRAFTIAPAVVGILYIALSIATVGTHAYGDANSLAPLSQLVNIGLGTTAKVMTGIVALLITMVAIHGNLAGFSRLVYSQAREGIFPASLGTLHAKRQTPTGALIALGLDFIIVLIIYVSCHVDLNTFVAWPSTVFLVLYGLAMAAGVRLMKMYKVARWMAFIPMVFCFGLFVFSGWACIYPIALAVVGWKMSDRISRDENSKAWNRMA